MRRLNQLSAAVMAFMLLVTPVFAANAPNNTVSPQVSAPIKKAIPALAKPDVKKVLLISQKYYELAISKATAHEKLYTSAIINWKPDFTGKTKNAAKASQYLNSSAYLTTYTDLKGIYLPFSAAVFALDINNATAAGNLASSIASYSEDTVNKPLGTAIKEIKEVKPYADDAAAVYEYALSLKLAKPTIDLSVMPLLLNYGYLSIDRDKLDTAKVMFETATKLAPGYMPAIQGMAAYWLAKGDKAKAKQLLESANTSVMYKQLKKMVEDTSEKKVPNVLPGDAPEVMENKLRALGAVEPVLATDFYEDIDPAGAAQSRQLVKSLQQSLKYTAIDYQYLTQFSTLENFVSDGGQAALDAFGEELSKLEEKLRNENMSDSEMNELEKALDNALEGPETGSDASLASLAHFVSPEMQIFKMMPADYANPTDLIAQKYNVGLLQRKMVGYEAYLGKQIDEINKVVIDDKLRLSERLQPLEEAERDELDRLNIEHEAVHKVGDDGICDACVIKTHQIHQGYDPQLNNLAETIWMDATNFVNARYVQRIKPNIGAMYVDCMRNCILISDPAIRAKTEENIRRKVENFSFVALSIALEAYSMDIGAYPHSCNCSTAEIEAASARETKAYEKSEAEKTAMQNKSRKAFESGELPENSQLYQRLDKYSASYQLMFMSAKWHPLKTEVSFGIKIPGMDTSIAAKMTENHMRNTTTYGGGLTATIGSGSAGGGAIDASASVSLQGEMTVDGKGNIIKADIVSTAKGTVTAGGIETSVTYEASVQRGCKLSGEVAKVYNDVIKIPEALEVFQPEKPENPRKVLWQGEYQVTK